jgi:hypothetical protein
MPRSEPGEGFPHKRDPNMIMLAVILALGLGTLLVVFVALIARQRRSSGIPPSSRLILPMSTGVKVLSGMSAKISAHPQNFSFRIDGLVIEDAENWVVNDLIVDGESQFVQPGDVPGDMFSEAGQGCGIRLDVAPVGADVAIVVTHVGEGSRAFLCMALGTPIHGNRSAEVSRLILPMSSGINILPGQSMQITGRPVTHMFRPERLVIHGGGDWLVHDLKVGNRSQFVQSGDVPGAAFEASAGATFCMDDVAPGGDFVLVATCVGAAAEGVPFLAGAVGKATKGRRRAKVAKPQDPQAVRIIPDSGRKLHAMP